MKAYDRTRRVAEEIRRELAASVGSLLAHPRASLLSFTAVRLTRDLSQAKVYVTHVLPDPAERQELLAALNAAAGPFRHQLAQRLSTSKVPELRFVYDDSIEYGARMERRLAELVKDLPPADDEQP